jgi:hypothetical protein
LHQDLIKDLPEFILEIIGDCHKLDKKERVEIDELVKRISETSSLKLSNLKGKEKWINQVVSPESGLVIINAIANGDLRVTFSESNNSVLKNSSTPCYNFVIGGHSNTISFLRRSNKSSSMKLSESVVVCDKNISQTYWFNINFKEKTISCGKGNPNLENAFLKWKDTNFISNLKYIGVSNYNDPIKISSIKIKKTLNTFDLNINEGFIHSLSELNLEPNYGLSKLFILDYLKLNDKKCSTHELNCHYLQNNCFIKIRSDHLYLRPSNCSKFVLNNSFKENWFNTYRGTHPENVKSIIEFGSSQLKSKENLICTTKVPLYAEWSSPTVFWKGKYFQTILILRQDPTKVKEKKSKLLNDDILKLYEGEDRISKDDIELVTMEEKSIAVHALLIKIHDEDPFGPGGEYSNLKEIIESKKIK